MRLLNCISMGIKERRTKILLGLLLLSDEKFSAVYLNQTFRSIFDLTFNQKTRGTLSGMMKEELIEKKVSVASPNKDENYTTIPTSIKPAVNEEETPAYHLTKKGFYQLCLKFPFFRFLFDQWDGKWRILSYEIPEKKRELRDRLRREVSGWGLGPWHRSFWLTPHPIIENLRELIYQKEEERYLQAFESKHIIGDQKILIEKVWQISTLEKKYRDLFKVWHDILSKPGQTSSKTGEKLSKFREVVNRYVEVLKSDPGLPTEVIGKNWIGFEAFNIFKEIRSILLS